MPKRIDPVLDCPLDEVPDAEALIQAAMRWHFSAETGTPYWLERAKSLDFDPIGDVRTFADLALFPNIVNELRTVPAEELIPNGLPERSELFGVFESGGTTGAPKRVVCMVDWMRRWLAFDNRNMDAWGLPRGLNWMTMVPSGPHMASARPREQVRSRGGILFTIDMDPRWVKKCIVEGRPEDAERYLDHLLKQAEFLLKTQNIGILTISPPLLERLARSDLLVDLVNEKVRMIVWQGAHMGADTRHILRTEVFPEVKLRGFYGSTMVLGGAFERMDLTDDDRCVFDPFSPYISYSVIDPETGAAVEYGERGQVVMHHVSKGQLLPNNLERDTAIRVKPLPGQLGDSVADVQPVASFHGKPVIEGVY
ncbi:phenazine antibiotic biosynthesis protein [Nonomuraea cavernae]|uniref:Phenazine antibiotic biosynthesis protein n=1 Tax=Nonomuraea cavernae TaxID=2045107 RepID=A0A917YP66_9ACTN|nr:phenazine antibiotic biosynthesis protein [Nonomuraea cavernae]MCA2183598.1 phenazine antibiotic biosynthesis protein [Nonomuraea cavernae]GGO60784.1 phenazine antibiotic biosynthesis protein [Nonomuraea cavernae]